VKEPSTSPLLMPISAVSRQFGVSRNTVYDLIAAGDLALVKLSPRISRVTVASVMALAGRRDRIGEKPGYLNRKGKTKKRSTKRPKPPEGGS